MKNDDTICCLFNFHGSFYFLSFEPMPGETTAMSLAAYLILMAHSIFIFAS